MAIPKLEDSEKELEVETNETCLGGTHRKDCGQREAHCRSIKSPWKGMGYCPGDCVSQYCNTETCPLTLERKPAHSVAKQPPRKSSGDVPAGGGAIGTCECSKW